MNIRFIITVVATFVMLMGFGFLVHGYLLAPEYAKLTNMFRSAVDSAPYMPFMLLADLIGAVGISWLYTKVRREVQPFLSQGVQFGFAIAMVMTMTRFLIYYAVQPMPSSVVVRQFVFDSIANVVMGVVIARINK